MAIPFTKSDFVYSRLIKLVEATSDLDFPVTALAREALSIAQQAGDDRFVQWVSFELEGYSNELPDYRMLPGIAGAVDRFGHWEYLFWEQVTLKMPTALVGNSLDGIENALEGDGHTIDFPLPQEIAKRTSPPKNLSASRVVRISTLQLHNILKAVRRHIVQWAKEQLEKYEGKEGLNSTMIQSVSQLTCRFCGNAVREPSRYCPHCGGAVGTPDVVPPVLVSTLTDATRTERVLEGKYKIGVKLGAGGMGTVYRAQRIRIKDEVAIKIMHPEYVADDTAMKRFRREARTAASLHHPNIVVIHDFGETDDSDIPAFIVMELLSGESLRDMLKREGGLELHRAILMMREICAGVAAAHRKGILHRDLKPENVIVSPPHSDSKSEGIKVVDFGLARLRDTGSDEQLTQIGDLVGTPCYMSPEQCRGEELDARSDVYSLAGLLYEMLSGAHPFMAASKAEIISKHLHETPTPLSKKLAVPQSIEDVIMRGLAKTAGERPEDADSFSRQLKEALEIQQSLVVYDPDKTPSETDEKGVLDYQAEIEEAFEQLTMILAKIGEETKNIGKKADAHSVNMQALTGTVADAARQRQKIGLMVASDMNLCAKRFENEVPNLAKCTEVIDEGISGLGRFLKRTPGDDEASILRSREILEQFSQTAHNGIDSLKGMRDVVASMKDMSKDVGRASRRLAAAIDSIIQHIVKVEAFAVQMLVIINRLLEQK